MNLTLDSTESADLREAVQALSRRLLEELAHADQRSYREMLRQKLQRFERLQAKLSEDAQPRTPPVEVIHFH